MLIRHTNVLKILFAILVSICISVICSFRSDLPKESNDTAGYAENYACLSKSNDVKSCDYTISASSSEYVYQYFAKLNSYFFDFEGFKLIFSFLVTLGVISSVLILSRGIFIPTLMLISDFRFWEYSANVLRHGLACTLFLVGLVFLVEKNSKLLSKLRFLAFVTHLASTILLFLPKKEVPKKVLLLILLIACCLVFTSQLWLQQITDLGLIDGKISYYLFNTVSYEFQVPIHYMFITIIGFFCYGKIKSFENTISFNVLILLLSSAIIFGLVTLSYRMASWMLPFVVICATYQLEYLSTKFHNFRLAAFSLFASIYLIGFGFSFFRNLEAFSIHLS